MTCDDGGAQCVPSIHKNVGRIKIRAAGSPWNGLDKGFGLSLDQVFFFLSKPTFIPGGCVWLKSFLILSYDIFEKHLIDTHIMKTKQRRAWWWLGEPFAGLVFPDRKRHVIAVILHMCGADVCVRGSKILNWWLCLCECGTHPCSFKSPPRLPLSRTTLHRISFSFRSLPAR